MRFPSCLWAHHHRHCRPRRRCQSGAIVELCLSTCSIAQYGELPQILSVDLEQSYGYRHRAIFHSILNAQDHKVITASYLVAPRSFGRFLNGLLRCITLPLVLHILRGYLKIPITDKWDFMG